VYDTNHCIHTISNFSLHNRLFNPTIVFPEARKVLPPQVIVDGRSRRNLTLISKVIQNISNGVDFGSKESYMIPLNPVIEQYKLKCRQFLMDSCVDEGTHVLKQVECKKLIQEAREQQLISSDPTLKKEIESIHTLLAKNRDRIVKSVNELQISEELANDLVNVLNRLPTLTPISMKKPLPPVPKKTELEASQEDKKYLELLEKAQHVKDIDLEAMNILTLRGTDKDGRPIVVFTEERVRKEDLDRVILYVVKKLDKVVERDYVMIWCVNNSANQQRPGFQWLLNFYRSLSRKYKKNMKSFYLVHPTFMFKVIIKCFRPFVSEKFWKKLHLCDRVSLVYDDIDKETLPLPPSILSYDFLLNKDNTQDIEPVFGVPIAEIMERPENKGQKLPKFLNQLFDHVRQYGLDAQGLFRVPGNVTETQKLKILLNNGDNIDFTHCDIHTVGTTLKQFFREMPEPLIPYELYSDFLRILRSDDNDNSIANHSYIEPVKGLVERLPHVNYLVARELFSLLVLINEHSDVNKMTNHNLAIVFGPNILRSKSENALSALQDNVHITRIVDFMITEFANIFVLTTKQRSRPTNVRFSTVNFMEQFIHEDEK
jgi:Rho GTPase-activating protein 1